MVQVKALLLSLATAIGYHHASAQATASWPLTATQQSTVSGQLSAGAQTLTGLVVNNYLSANGGQRILPDGTGAWPAETGFNNSRYVEYTVAPNGVANYYINTIGLSLSFNSSSAGRARICWSVNGTTFNDLAAAQTLVSGSVPSALTYSGLNIAVPAGNTFRLRVYPWTTTALTGRYLVSKDVQIAGMTADSLQVAFPGAEGGGRHSSGGRGGSIYYVTNLNNSGAGSLRDAVSQPNRTILFKVSGTINLLSPLTMQRDNITIAGQTAPGDGICLANYGVRIMANNIIIRYLRSRPGDIIINPGDTTKVVDAMYNSFGSPASNPYRNIIIDHCSLSWSTDELGSFYAIADFTLQWSMLSEALYQSIHDKATPHGYGGIWGGQNASFHHNLIAHNGNRNPRFSGSAATGQPEKEYVDFRNNVVYNWVGSAYGGTGGQHNMVNNYYKPGPATTGSSSCATSNRRHRILLYTTYTVTGGDTTRGGKFYIKGNYVDGYSCVIETTDTATNNWRFGVHPDSSPGAAVALAAGKSDTAFHIAPVITETAVAAFESVTATAGASLPRRDTVDRRIIHETRTGTATYGDSSYQAAGMGTPSGMIDSQNSVGGWPVLSSTTYADDTDNDGLPNWWEAMVKGNNDTLGVNANDWAINGFTQLENYLNGVQSPDQPVAFTTVQAAIVGADSVRLTVQTDWAKDQFRLALYRSTDNVNFTKLSETDANINTVRYAFDDYAAPAQQLYYKIGSQRIDGTGSTVFSATQSVNNAHELLTTKPVLQSAVHAVAGEAAIPALTVYPNPAGKQLFVKHQPAAVQARIRIFTITGNQVAEQAVPAGRDRTSINIDQLLQGTYVLIFRNGQQQEKTVFVRQ
ncbi:T9SS type A sorting domain-containing protein [Paraflavitalea pollutisoli]|uniref:T9SS type A sorting domain-containing protein n=1 Tax=Paraflavitalea pollutisoli TaxID=3034143 RepID=UPI0023EC1902|nr:T9SS type A sorting domain-containing protein [Paraflavitalea sp. H1-2-19X]